MKRLRETGVETIAYHLDYLLPTDEKEVLCEETTTRNPGILLGSPDPDFGLLQSPCLGDSETVPGLFEPNARCRAVEVH
jgi:hypothetical protein